MQKLFFEQQLEFTLAEEGFIYLVSNFDPRVKS